MKALQCYVVIVIALLIPLTSSGDDQPGASNNKRMPTEAELLGQFREAARAIEQLEKDIGLFGKDQPKPPANEPAVPLVAPVPGRATGPLDDLVRQVLGGIPDRSLMDLRQHDDTELGRAVTQKMDELARFQRRLRLQEFEVLAVQAWQALGAAQARLGDLNAARESWKQAAQRASACANAEEMLLILRDMALDQEAAGDHKAALDTLAIIMRLPTSNSRPMPPLAEVRVGDLPEDPTIRNMVVLAKAYAKLHAPEVSLPHFAQALMLAEHVPNPVRRVSAILVIAAAQESRDAKTTRSIALHIAHSIQDPLERSTALETVLRAFVAAGAHEQTLETLAERLEGDIKRYCLWAVADELADGEKMPERAFVEQVLALARKAEFDSAEKKGRVFARLAHAQARLGDEEAYRTLDAIARPDAGDSAIEVLRKLDVMYALARHYLKDGKRDTAKDTVQVALELADPILQVLPEPDLTELVSLQAEIGEPAGALQTAGLVQRSSYKVTGLVAFAIARGKAGDRDAARAAFAKARKVAAEIMRDELWLFTRYRDIRLGSSNFRKGVDPAVATLSAQQTMAKALHTIAKAQLELGEMESALATTNEMRQCGEFAHPELVLLCREIATARIAVRDFKNSSDALNLISDLDRRTSQVLRATYFRERLRDEFLQGIAPGLLQIALGVENQMRMADQKLQAITGYAEGVVAFKNAGGSFPGGVKDKPAKR